MPATDDEREKLGEALYLKVSEFQPEEVAGKITGMMLNSLEANEIQSVVDDEPSLRVKVEEALQLLRKEAEKDQISLLQDELRQAEQWADSMQRDWDEKESGWKKEKEELMERIAALERAKKEKGAGNKVDEEQIESAKRRVGAINDQNAKLEESLREIQQRSGELETVLQKARKSTEDVQNTAKVAEEKLIQAETLKVDAEKEEEAVKAELQEAEKWCEKTETKYKQELADKEIELEKANAALKSASDVAKQKSKSPALDDLQDKLRELETLGKSTSQHANESESLTKKAEAEVAAIEVRSPKEGKQVAGDRSKLQSELAKLQSEIENYRSKVEGDGRDMSEEISDAEREARKAREERIRVEELIADAQREMNAIRSH